jgi:hypothetical protein
MRKLHLDLDNLQVASFATTPAETPARGTVRGLDDAGMQAVLDMAATGTSACSWTDGVVACKTCGSVLHRTLNTAGRTEKSCACGGAGSSS